MEDIMNAFVSSCASTIQEVQRDPDLPSKVIFVASFFSLRILQPIRRLLQNNPNGSSSTPSVAGVSERAETHFMTPPMHYFVDWIRASENQYDARKNPTGSLPLAVAENKLMAVENASSNNVIRCSNSVMVGLEIREYTCPTSRP